MDMIFKCEYCGTDKEKVSEEVLGTKIHHWKEMCDCKDKLLKAKKEIKERAGKRKLLKYRYKKALFARKLRGKRLKNLTCEYLDKAKLFVDTFRPRRKGFFFIGKAGNGKTTLANCIGKELLLKGYSVLTMNFAEYLNKLQQTYSGRSEISFDDLLEQWTNKTDLLIIDDFGREKYTDKRLENTFLFFDKLYNNCTSYIITANPENVSKLKEISEFNALFDRLSENLDKMVFKKNSYRRLLDVA